MPNKMLVGEEMIKISQPIADQYIILLNLQEKTRAE